MTSGHQTTVLCSCSTCSEAHHVLQDSGGFIHTPVTCAAVSRCSAMQDKLLSAEQQYTLLKQRNQAELVRLNLQRAEDFNKALARFAVLQAQAAAAAADVWSGVADQLVQ